MFYICDKQICNKYENVDNKSFNDILFEHNGLCANSPRQTYGVVKVTYDSHLDMIPTLKEEEKAQIYAWLIEAREFALDAENSNKKHAAFGKYKGRINNYLAKRGYDLKKEREEWYKRIKARGGSI